MSVTTWNPSSCIYFSFSIFSPSSFPWIKAIVPYVVVSNCIFTIHDLPQSFPLSFQRIAHLFLLVEIHHGNILLNRTRIWRCTSLWIFAALCTIPHRFHIVWFFLFSANTSSKNRYPHRMISAPRFYLMKILVALQFQLLTICFNFFRWAHG